MPIQELNTDMLLLIIQNISIEKDKEIAELNKRLDNEENKCNNYYEALHRAGVENFQCVECEEVYIDLDGETYDNNWCNDDGECYCGGCLDDLKYNVDRQNEIMKTRTNYKVHINNDKNYNTYEEIPMCYKTSNIYIEKRYINNWELYINEGECVISETMNGDKNNYKNHKSMLEELEEIFNITDIYLYSVLEVHKPPISQRLPNVVGYCYDTDIWYRTVPIKTLLNCDWCKPKKCEVFHRMLGRSWYKREGYSSGCACAYKSLTEKYKKTIF
jgi:hypothetical protein